MEGQSFTSTNLKGNSLKPRHRENLCITKVKEQINKEHSAHAALKIKYGIIPSFSEQPVIEMKGSRLRKKEK